ncbi:hypothetical protein BUALT_Bualt14G0128200 [Buddleja alternifolia]|uniref:KIB1-4 beta-propeller domain-containing protein n=1 Tax=Buddleja alternifolia TaxID=168488 RepID=A0AAV6WU68_9LAMI|nr:hypothetical protein BUALT_Bualt14G0128200 [Buddleja alternifolia]
MTGWADLPEELLSLISNLFDVDRCIFSLVCKSWNAASTISISPYRCSPYLMSFQLANGAWKFFQDNDIFYKMFPKLPRAEIRCSKYGWLLMSENPRSLFFFDPFNRRRIYLPKSNFPYTIICFFYKPTSPHCFIVGIANRLDGLSVDIGVLMLNHGESKWKKYTYHSKTPFYVSICNPVLHRGLLYCLDVEGNIATFDINKHGTGTSWIVHTKCIFSPQLRQKIHQHFLIKVCDILFAIFVAHEQREVNVFKFLEPDMKWEVVHDLGDKMFYVSHTACFAQIDPQTSMANKIYFPKLHGDDSVFYSLKTRKYHSFKGDYSSKEPYGLKDLAFATWIVPTPFEEFSRDLAWCPEVDNAIN